MANNKKKYYVLVITDRDGDSHSYFFLASNPWMVTHFVVAITLIDGDFYGHKTEDAIEVTVNELMKGPETFKPIELN